MRFPRYIYVVLYYMMRNNWLSDSILFPRKHNSLIKKKINNRYRIPANYESDDYFLLHFTSIRNRGRC